MSAQTLKPDDALHSKQQKHRNSLSSRVYLSAPFFIKLDLICLSIDTNALCSRG